MEFVKLTKAELVTLQECYKTAQNFNFGIGVNPLCSRIKAERLPNYHSSLKYQR